MAVYPFVVYISTHTLKGSQPFPIHSPLYDWLITTMAAMEKKKKVHYDACTLAPTLFPIFGFGEFQSSQYSGYPSYLQGLTVTVGT